MNGIAKIIGASSIFSDLINQEKQSSIIYAGGHFHYFDFGENEFRLEIKKTKFAKDFIEIEGWLVNDEYDLGRIGIHFFPNKCN